VLFLGRVHPKKGLDVLLNAWRAIEPRFKDWDLRIVGPDNDGYLHRMKQLAADLGLQRVRFDGPLHGDAKWEAYRAAALFVLPTHSENFGISVAEALAAGTPVIVTKGAPWPQLEAQGAGWWIELGTEALVPALERAIDLGVETLSGMGQAGRAWMIRDYSWSRIGRTMAEVYLWLLRGGSPPASVRVN
jgi:glycosyltransferase involved in cell wall biosynthesis